MQKATDDKGHPSPRCSYLPTLNRFGVREVREWVVVEVGEKGVVARHRHQIRAWFATELMQYFLEFLSVPLTKQCLGSGLPSGMP